MLGGPEAGKRLPPGEAAKEVTLVLTDVQVGVLQQYSSQGNCSYALSAAAVACAACMALLDGLHIAPATQQPSMGDVLGGLGPQIRRLQHDN